MEVYLATIVVGSHRRYGLLAFSGFPCYAILMLFAAYFRCLLSVHSASFCFRGSSLFVEGDRTLASEGEDTSVGQVSSVGRGSSQIDTRS